MAISSPLLEREGFRNGFSTREVDLTLDASRADLSAFSERIGIDAATVRQAKQVHGTRVLDAGEATRSSDEEADALFSPRDFAVGVRVADCVPVLVGDTRSGAVLAIHAGWRGLVHGVIDRAIERLFVAEPASTASDLVAAVGPHIGLSCFEVGEEVAAEVVRYTGTPQFVDRSREKPHVDLLGATRHALRRIGLADTSVDVLEGCTRCDAARFHSYRRDGSRSGRHLALVAPRA